MDRIARLVRPNRGAALPLAGLALLLLVPAVARAAGNVRVGSVTPGGDLRVNGDAANNDIEITQNANGDIVITGRNGTTVNGQPSVTRSGVTGELKVNTRGGDDTVEIDGVQVEDLEIEDEIGRNDIDVKKTRVNDKMEIENRDGSIDIEDSAWGRREIDPGQGSVNPRNLSGRGGAGQVGTPPSPRPDDDDEGEGSGSKAPGQARQGGKEATLPSTNPAQQGVIRPDGPKVDHPKVPDTKKAPSYTPKY